jgi:tetratricopeptide (TPR) repeat protein
MNGTLDLAQTLHLRGRLAEAETQYRKVLQWQPDAVEALRGLGALAYQRGRVDEAVALFARGVAIRPEAADFHANLAEAMRLLKRSDEANEHALKALALDPNLSGAWNTLGLLAHEQERFQDAEIAFREAIRLRADHVSAYINLGSTLLARGRVDDALQIVHRAHTLEPENAASLTNLGQILIETGNLDLLDEAEQHCRRAVALAPRLTQAINTLGNVLRLQGRVDEALECYLQAIRLDPRRATPCHNMGKALQERGDYVGAISWFEHAQALQNDPARYFANQGCLWAARKHHEESARCYRLALAHASGMAEAHQGLGEALLEQGRIDDAETCFREAIQLAPTSPFAWVALARLHAERGDVEQSCLAARQALARRPNLAEALIQLACNLKGLLPAEDIHAIEELLGQKYLTDDRRSLLYFGLAGVFDAQGEFAAAAACLENANRLQTSARDATGQRDDPGHHSQFVDRIIVTFTPEVIARVRPCIDSDPRPVFVVGLPRSGTTLIEQILASHPGVYGAGERPDVRRVFQSLPELVGRPVADPFDVVVALEPSAARAGARRYLDLLSTAAPATARRIVDKMPDNIELIGLIAMLWPGAHVIVTSRDLRDVAVSCWQTGFASIRWANDFEQIAHRFADYQRILDYWRRTRPLEWLDISYEKLVHDPEGQSRLMIEFLELDWNPSVLHFHTTRRTVRSASQLQVREPIHSRSIGRWKNYERELQPLFRALERTGIDVAQSGDSRLTQRSSYTE